MSYEQSLVFGLGLASIYFMIKSYVHPLTDFKTFMEFEKDKYGDNDVDIGKKEKENEKNQIDFKRFVTYSLSEIYKIISYLLLFALVYVMKEVSLLNVPGSNTAGVFDAIFLFTGYFFIFEALLLVIKVAGSTIDLFRGFNKDFEENFD